MNISVSNNLIFNVVKCQVVTFTVRVTTVYVRLFGTLNITRPPSTAIPMPLIMAKFDTVYDRLCDDKKNKDREAYRKNQENLQATTRLDQVIIN